jgi:hypothetical protein
VHGRSDLARIKTAFRALARSRARSAHGLGCRLWQIRIAPSAKSPTIPKRCATKSKTHSRRFRRLFTQIAVPLATPYTEMWIFGLLDVSLATPNFRVIGDPAEFVGRRQGRRTSDYITYDRLFCGFTLWPCIQRIVVPEFRAAPKRWKMAPAKILVARSRLRDRSGVQ